MVRAIFKLDSISKQEETDTLGNPLFKLSFVPATIGERESNGFHLYPSEGGLSVSDITEFEVSNHVVGDEYFIDISHTLGKL